MGNRPIVFELWFSHLQYEDKNLKTTGCDKVYNFPRTVPNT